MQRRIFYLGWQAWSIEHLGTAMPHALLHRLLQTKSIASCAIPKPHTHTNAGLQLQGRGSPILLLM